MIQKIALIVAIFSACVGVIALTVAMNSSGISSNALIVASNALDATTKNTELIISEAKITRKEAKETGENITSTIASEAKTTRENITSTIISEAKTTRENITSTIISEAKTTREEAKETGGNIVTAINSGNNLVVDAINKGFQHLANNPPATSNQNIGDEQLIENLGPTSYLEAPAVGSDARRSLHFFKNGVLVLSPPNNSSVYEILAPSLKEIGQLPPFDTKDLVIVPGNFSKSHVTQLQAVTERFHNEDIVAVPINEDSQAISLLWQVVSEATSQKSSSQSELSANGGKIENGIKISYGTPLTVVLSK